MTEKAAEIYLASRSPRRKELLAQLKIKFQILDIEVDEAIIASETAMEYVQRLAIEKAMTGHQIATRKNIPVLGSDTCIAFQGEIIGKPNTAAEAVNILSKLSGKEHTVMTAVALANESGYLFRVQTSKVAFKDLSDAEIKAYINTGEPLDKAGAYAIQGLGAVFIRHIEGSYSGIMGLPLFETAELLNEFGINVVN